MRRIISILMTLALIAPLALPQTPQQPAKPEQQEPGPNDVIRISTQLMQTDVVVTDKSEQVIKDLKLEDFELFDNGKKQDLKFMEFVSVDSGRRAEGKRPTVPAGVDTEVAKGVSSKDLKRVIAFVVDDLTIPILDLPGVRALLLDFVNNKMVEGDLVAIVRVVGGRGLLQQFTTDKTLLRRAISQIRNVSNPNGVSDSPQPGYQKNLDRPVDGLPSQKELLELQLTDPPDPTSTINNEEQKLRRGEMTLTTAGFVVDSLKEVPGRKNLVMISAGIPIFEVNSYGSQFSNISYLLGALSDHAFRAGVAISTMDPRGLESSRAVKSMSETVGKSAMDRPDPSFGRGSGDDIAPLLSGAGEGLGLTTLAKTTGGFSTQNTNDFPAALEKILSRSSGYYELAYSPREKFDGKAHRIEIKVHRPGAKAFHPSQYVAKEDTARGSRSKEEQITAAAISPLARRDIEVTSNLAIKLLPSNKAAIDIHLLIEAGKLHFTEKDGKYQTSLDIVGFVYDQLGKKFGGFSETVNLDYSKENYEKALAEGLTYSSSLELPAGYYQVRSVVRESTTGGLGTIANYLEIPQLSKGHLAMSSVFLFAVDGTNPTPLEASRMLKRTQDLRYVAMIYNAKMKGGKPQVNAQMIISQAGKVLLREPEQPIESPASGTAALVKLGQFGLSKVPPGRYVLTVIISDPNDKKDQALSRSIDFIVAK